MPMTCDPWDIFVESEPLKNSCDNSGFFSGGQELEGPVAVSKLKLA